MHPRIRVDLDQPDRKILHHDEIGAVQLEATPSPVHVFLGGQHRQDYGLRHFRIDLVVVRLAAVPRLPDNYIANEIKCVTLSTKIDRYIGYF